MLAHAVSVMTAQVDTINANWTVTAGSLSDTYRLLQFHFHWGSDSTTGSEHTINSKQYPLEVWYVRAVMLFAPAVQYYKYNSTYGSSFSSSFAGQTSTRRQEPMWLFESCYFHTAVASSSSYTLASTWDMLLPIAWPSRRSPSRTCRVFPERERDINGAVGTTLGWLLKSCIAPTELR